MSKKRKKHTKQKKNTHQLSLTDEILRLFNDFPDRKLNYKQIASLLNKNNSQFRKQIYSILSDLADKGFLKEVSLGKFKINKFTEGHDLQSNKKSGLIVGVIETNKRGAGYVIVEGKNKDIYIAEKNRNRSLNGDKVAVKLLLGRKGKKLEGKVVEVVEFANKTIVGTLDVTD